MNNINAEVICFYDNYSDNFRNNFEPFEEVRGNVKKWVYIDYGNIKKPSIDDLIVVHRNSSKKSLIGVFEELGLYHEELTRDELLDDIYSSGCSLDDFVEALDNNGVRYDKNYVEVITRGYSQGDYAEVIIPTKKLRGVWGSPKSVEDGDLVTKRVIDNYFWDAPVYLRVDLNLNNTDYEFYGWDMDLPEYWNHPYDMDDAKEQVLKYIRNKFKNVAAVEKIVQAVDDAFPAEVKYPKN